MDLRDKTIAVTGASGFLGGYIALDLLQRGARVRCVVRTPEKCAWLVDKGATTAKADLMDVAALTQAFRGCDAVVSNAALYTLERKSWQDFYDANLTGTVNVLDAAAAAGVKRVVDVSTCGVYRVTAPFNQPITEESPRLTIRDRWWMWAYPVTKAIAEQAAWDKAKEHGLDLTVVRPAGIFGPRDLQAVPRFEWFLGLPFLPAPIFRFPFSHAADVARGISGALENDAAIGRAYNLSGERGSIGEILRTWKKVAGRGPLLIPLWTPFGMNYDNSAAKRDLGFSNRPLEDTIRDIVESRRP